MRRLTMLAGTLVFAAVALTGCPAEPKPERKPVTRELTVRVSDQDGNLVIQKFHVEGEIVELFPGDRLAWTCQFVEGESVRPCPEEIAFSVRDIKNVANLSWQGPGEDVERRVNEFVERYESIVEGESTPEREAVERMMAELPPEALEAPERSAFEHELTTLTTYGAGRITSPPYRGFDRDLLWKFEWVAERGPEDRDVWDPHFRGHRR